jgi:hypothetical protein
VCGSQRSKDLLKAAERGIRRTNIRALQRQETDLTMTKQQFRQKSPRFSAGC